MDKIKVTQAELDAFRSGHVPERFEVDQLSKPIVLVEGICCVDGVPILGARWDATKSAMVARYNLHPALVAACKAALEHINGRQAPSYSTCDICGGPKALNEHEEWCIIAKLKAAIAAAEKEAQP